MQTSALPTKPQKTWRLLIIGMLGGALFLLVLLVSGLVWWINSASRPRSAPEAEKVLQAQTGLPFQRKGPVGERMLQLIYPMPKANTLEFTPAQAGDFCFNCPHLIYRGVMTVEE
jgi:hypothetical protein